MSRDALLIAINDYADQRAVSLRYAQADALAVGEGLRTRCGFNVHIVVGEDATRNNLLGAMQSLPGGDTLLVYFALHGQMRHGCYLLHTFDSDIEGKNALTFAEVVRQCAVDCGYTEVAFVLDACRRADSDTFYCPSPSIGPMGPTGLSDNVRDIAAQIKTHVQNITRQTLQTTVDPEDVAWIEVLYGCSDGQYCYEDEDLEHGLFSHGLVSALTRVKGRNLSLRDWGDRAARIIKQWSEGRAQRLYQQPMHYSATGRDGIVIYSGNTSHAGTRLSCDGKQVHDDTSYMRECVSRIDHGRLDLLHSIGQGGMGRVWLARDRRLNRLVALKCPLDAVVNSKHGLRRFLQEARVAAQLKHSSIVNIYNVHEMELNDDGTQPLIEMEYIEGQTLHETVERRGQGLETEEVLELAVKLCEALEEAHLRNVIHRDIKPGNIILSVDGMPKIVDFGIASAAQGSGITRYTQYTMTGRGLGSLHYSAPEQLKGLEADSRSDIYALGASLYYAFSGRELSGIISRTAVPAALVPVIEKACQALPEDRYASMVDFRQALVSAGRQSIGSGYVASEALCPHCGRDNPESYKHCRHCGGSLAELFRSCPKCEQEIRKDMAFCASCGCSVALECMRNDIAEVKAHHDYEKLKILADAGAEQFPDTEEFQGDLDFAIESIRSRDALVSQLESAENDGQRMKLLRELLDLCPSHEDYRSEHARIWGDYEELKKKVQNCNERHDYRSLLKITEEGTTRFPDDLFFVEHHDLAQTNVNETERLEEALQKSSNDSQRLEFLQAFLALYPKDKNYYLKYEKLKSKYDAWCRRIDKEISNRNYKQAEYAVNASLVEFPNYTPLIQREEYVKKMVIVHVT